MPTLTTKTSTINSAEIEEQLRQWHKQIPDIRNGSMRRRWIKALQRKSMKAAIAAKCEDCMAFEQAEIKRCEIVHCPLFQYRPGAQKDGGHEQAILASLDRIAGDSCL